MAEFFKVVEGLFYAIATNVFATVIVNGCCFSLAKIINSPDNARFYKKNYLKYFISFIIYLLSILT